MFCNYHCTHGLEYFSRIGTHKGWKDYQGVIHNTYQSGHIEADQHVILYISEDVSKHFDFPKFTPPGPGNTKKVLDSDTKMIDIMYLYGKR